MNTNNDEKKIIVTTFGIVNWLLSYPGLYIPPENYTSALSPLACLQSEAALEALAWVSFAF